MLSRLFLLLFLSACAFYPRPLSRVEVSQGTYVILADMSQGTAWVVAPHYLMTAGHVCDGASSFVIEDDGRKFPATAVLWEEDGPYKDLCLLHTDATLAPPLKLAPKMPTVGDAVAYVGFPYKKYVESAGKYMGDLDGEETYNDYTFSAACAPGASGSAVYTHEGVWGVLVRRRTDGNFFGHDGSDGCVAIPVESIRSLLRDAHVRI